MDCYFILECFMIFSQRSSALMKHLKTTGVQKRELTEFALSCYLFVNIYEFQFEGLYLIAWVRCLGL